MFYAQLFLKNPVYFDFLKMIKGKLEKSKE